MTDRQRLASALNQHCGGETKRKRYMSKKWSVSSFWDLSDPAIVLIMAWVQPGYIPNPNTKGGSWAISPAASADIQAFAAEDDKKNIPNIPEQRMLGI